MCFYYSKNNLGSFTWFSEFLYNLWQFLDYLNSFLFVCFVCFYHITVPLLTDSKNPLYLWRNKKNGTRKITVAMGYSLLEQPFTQALLVLLCCLLAVSVSFTCSAGSSMWSPNAKEIQSTGDPPVSARKAIPHGEKPTEWQAAQGCQTCFLWGCSALCYPSTTQQKWSGGRIWVAWHWVCCLSMAWAWICISYNICCCSCFSLSVFLDLSPVRGHNSFLKNIIYLNQGLLGSHSLCWDSSEALVPFVIFITSNAICFPAQIQGFINTVTGLCHNWKQDVCHSYFPLDVWVDLCRHFTFCSLREGYCLAFPPRSHSAWVSSEKMGGTRWKRASHTMWVF